MGDYLVPLQSLLTKAYINAKINQPILPNMSMAFMLKTTLRFLLLFALVLPSCVHHRELLNFNEGPDFSTMPDSSLYTALKIQPDDLLNISIQSADAAASAPYSISGSSLSTGAGAASANSTSSSSNGFLVDPDGNIFLPEIGAVKVAGLSTFIARDTITNRLKKYLRSPIVNVRMQNFKFTVLGEVEHAGSFSIPNERINILEAIGMAGDVGSYGNRANILVVREENGRRSFGRINLHQRDIFKSTYFYLKQNDLIYVEPIPVKTATITDGVSKYIQWITPIISILSIIITLSK